MAVDESSSQDSTLIDDDLVAALGFEPVSTLEVSVDDAPESEAEASANGDAPADDIVVVDEERSSFFDLEPENADVEIEADAVVGEVAVDEAAVDDLAVDEAVVDDLVVDDAAAEDVEPVEISDEPADEGSILDAVGSIADPELDEDATAPVSLVDLDLDTVADADAAADGDEVAADEAVVGEAAVGEAAVGEAAVGEAVVGEAAVGEAVVGEAAVGEAAVGEAAVGEAAVGEAAVGEAAAAHLIDLDTVDLTDEDVDPAADGDEVLGLADADSVFADASPLVEAPPFADDHAVTETVGQVGFLDLDEAEVATAPEVAAATAATTASAAAVPATKRRRRIRARKSRRVIRHIDPWSVLTFSVLFHMVVFAALLLSSVLVWNAAIASGMVENVESFIQELGDYETFEINADVMFQAAIVIAGMLTLASSVLVVLLTVVFNLISDLVGGIRVTVIEEETVRVPIDKKSSKASNE